MNLLSSSKSAASATLCAVVVGCASVDTAPPTVVRTPAPQNYEKTVTNYLAFRIRNAPKNAEISVGAPEPGACSLDAYTTSSRGWVVPVAYVTRSGEVTGKETIRINAKQYYFWFLGNTIAGITPRIDLCPGVGSGFEMPSPEPVPLAATGTAKREADGAAAGPQSPDSDRIKPAAGQKSKASASTKKKSSSKARPPAKAKTGNSDTAKPS